MLGHLSGYSSSVQIPAIPTPKLPADGLQDDISVGRYVAATAAQVVGAAVGAGGMFANAIESGLRGGIANAKKIWNSDKIGYDTKAYLIATAVPVAVASAQPLSVFGGAAWGQVRAYNHVIGESGTIKGAIQQIAEDVAKVGEVTKANETKLADFLIHAMASAGKKYDVSLPQAATGLAAGILSGAWIFGMTALLSAVRTPEVVANLVSNILTNDEQGPLTKLAASQLVTGIASDVAPAAPIAVGTTAYGQALILGATQGWDAALEATGNLWSAIYKGSLSLLVSSAKTGLKRLG